MGVTPPRFPASPLPRALTFPFMFVSSPTVLPGSGKVFSGYPPDLTRIQCGKEENAECLYGIGI